MSVPELVPPSEEYRESYSEALRESQDEWEHLDAEPELPAHEAHSGQVPRTTWWLVDGGEYIGTAWMRHVDPEHLLDAGGHIGYEIRPSKRGQGYGKLILKLTLEKARDSGYESVVLLCNVDNRASQKVIESNGGVQVGERTLKRKRGSVKHLIYMFELE